MPGFLKLLFVYQSTCFPTSQDKDQKTKSDLGKLMEETKLKIEQLKEQQKVEIEEALKEATTSKENLDQEQQQLQFEVQMWNMYIRIT